MGHSRDLTTDVISHLEGASPTIVQAFPMLSARSLPSDPVKKQAREAGANGERGMQSEPAIH